MTADLTRALTAAREAVELGEKATKGPWDAYYVHDAVRHIARNCRDMWLGGEDCTFRWDRNNDADLIAHAGTHYATVSRALIAQADEATALRARVAELEEALREISSRRPKIPPDDDGYPDSGNADDARDYGYDRAYTACADIADRALTPEPRR